MKLKLRLLAPIEKVHAITLSMKKQRMPRRQRKKAAKATKAAATTTAPAAATTDKKKKSSESGLKTTLGDLFKDHISNGNRANVFHRVFSKNPFALRRRALCAVSKGILHTHDDGLRLTLSG